MFQTIEYFTGMKENGVLIHEKIQMNLKNIMLSSYKGPHNTCFNLHGMSKMSKSIEIESRFMVVSDWEVMAKWYRISLLG